MADYQIIVLPNDLDATQDVTVRGEWSDEIVDRLAKMKFGRLLLAGIDWPDFEGLAPIARRITSIHLVGFRASSQGLEKLINLRELNLDAPLDPPLDLSVFQALETARIFWDKKLPRPSFALPVLAALEVQHFGEADCSVLSQAHSLERLDMRQGPVKSLKGLEHLEKLKVLKVRHMRVLHDISALNSMHSLADFEIEACPKVADLAPVEGLASLQRLACGDHRQRFEDLRWLNRMPLLEQVANGANVLSVDWSLVFRHPCLREFASHTHEGYDVSDEELRRLAATYKKRIASIKRFPNKKSPGFALVLEDES